MNKTILAAAVLTAFAGTVTAGNDFGAFTEKLLRAQTFKYFGFFRPAKDIASDGATDIERAPGQTAKDLVDVARGLRARILTREAAQDADMFSFWPAENPTHLIFCIEESLRNLTAVDGAPQLAPGIDKLIPAVQSIEIASGEVKTILRGMNRCDGIRTTAWGTVLATEEAGDGQAYEIIDPLSIDNHTVTNRASATGDIIDKTGAPSTMVAKRGALATMAWEGLIVLDSGVVIGGDELRPGTGAPDKDGGAIFKFVPAVAHPGGEIGNLGESPLIEGSNYAMRVQCTSGTQYGQGCEIGNADWVSVSAANARDDADAAGATGYYRPEDMHVDPTYSGEGVRFCWANTGNTGASNWGEVICGVDSAPLTAEEGSNTVVVNRFVEGDSFFNAHDNLAFQPITGNLYVIEDRNNGEIWACLPDGADRDIKTDGCVRVLTVKDKSAEPTGFAFSPDGRVAYLSVQHSGDSDMPLVDDFRTDDILIIEGFRIRKNMKRGHKHRKDD